VAHNSRIIVSVLRGQSDGAQRQHLVRCFSSICATVGFRQQRQHGEDMAAVPEQLVSVLRGQSDGTKLLSTNRRISPNGTSSGNQQREHDLEVVEITWSCMHTCAAALLCDLCVLLLTPCQLLARVVVSSFFYLIQVSF
jgi:hypothetical protein